MLNAPLASSDVLPRHGLPVGARRVKRAMDIAGALVGLAIFGPLMALLAALIWLRMGRPILFLQRRPGRHGEIFNIVKFRTMNAAKDAEGRLLPDAERITALGRFLRVSSLDELPGFFNVLRGEMSLVGPRPLLVDYLPRYDAFQARRHEVKPGLTGLAQVSGRNALSWNEKFALDVWYVDHWSVWGDVKIMARTVWKVVSRHGISAEGHATMPNFMGSNARFDSPGVSANSSAEATPAPLPRERPRAKP